MSKTERKLYNFYDVLDLYAAQENFTGLDAELTAVIRYYKEGDAWYTRNVKQMDRSDFQDKIEFLEDFKKTAEAMATMNDARLIIQNDEQSINLDPFIRFIEKNSAGYCKNMLQVIQSMLVLYLHENNIVAFKECTETLDRAELAFMQIELLG